MRLNYIWYIMGNFRGDLIWDKELFNFCFENFILIMELSIRYEYRVIGNEINYKEIYYICVGKSYCGGSGLDEYIE